jgi:hypothetical protein
LYSHVITNRSQIMADQPEKKFVDPRDATEHGYHGYVLDPTPNEDYTVAGVTKAAREAEGSRKRDTDESTSTKSTRKPTS